MYSFVLLIITLLLNAELGLACGFCSTPGFFCCTYTGLCTGPNQSCDPPTPSPTIPVTKSPTKAPTCDYDMNYADCQPITCNTGHGKCEQASCYGPTGSGGCSRCYEGYWDLDCNSQVKCNKNNGECSKGKCFGVLGNGNCDRDSSTGYYLCKSGWAGPACNKEVTCLVDHTTNGNHDPLTGKCIADTCKEGWQGVNCEIEVKPPGCICETPECLDFKNNLDCDECLETNFGPDCSGTVATCVQGVCPPGTCSGPKGNGKCACVFGWKGDDCGTPIEEDNKAESTNAPSQQGAADVNNEQYNGPPATLLAAGIGVGGAGTFILIAQIIQRYRKATPAEALLVGQPLDNKVDNPLFQVKIIEP